MSYRLSPLEIPFPFWRAAPRTAPGTQILAIGDLHGCGRLLIEMMHAFGSLSPGQLPPARNRQVMLLGDIIDRGPNSLQILRALYQIRDNPEIVVLKGNHESILLDCIDGRPGAIEAWLKYGGDSTVHNLGLPFPNPDADEAVFASRLAEEIGEPILDWLRELPLSFTSGDYFFCHAGVKPGVPLEEQRDDDLLWIRSSFLNSRRFHGKMVVHGHSIQEKIVVTPNRIGIDTGAYESGLLTGLILQGDRAWCLEVTLT